MHHLLAAHEEKPQFRWIRRRPIMAALLNKPGRRMVLLILLMAALLVPSACLAWAGRDVPHLGYFQDDGLYWIGAKSMAEGHGYRILSLSGQPYQTKFPPLYPFLLSAIWKMDPSFPRNLRWGLLLGWFMLPAYLGLAYCLLRRLGAPKLWIVMALMAVNPVLVFLSLNLLPELLFSCLVFGCLIIAEKASESPEKRMLWIAAGLLAGSAYLTKTAAVALAPAVVVGLLARRRLRAAALFLAAMLPAVVAWSFWQRAHLAKTADLAITYYTDYIGFYLVNVSLRSLPGMLAANVNALLKGTGNLVLFNRGNATTALLASSIVAGLVLFGIAQRFERTGVKFYHLFAIFYSLELIAWNFHPNERFLLPLFPMAAAAVVEALDRLRLRWRRWGTAVAAAAAVIFAATVVQGTGRFIPTIFEQSRERLAELHAAFPVLARDCSGGPVISRQDTLLYLYGGQAAVALIVPTMPFYEGDSGALWQPFRAVPEFARKHGAPCLLSASDDYQLDAVISNRAAREAIFNQDTRLHAFFESPGVRIYRID